MRVIRVKPRFCDGILRRMDQAGSHEIAGSRAYVPGYTLDRGISVDRAGALVDAHDNATGSRVVIRLLSPALSADAAYRRQVRHDMGVLRALRHQHLLSVIAFDDRHAAIVYEWVDGITLGHLVDASGAARRCTGRVRRLARRARGAARGRDHPSRRDPGCGRSSTPAAPASSATRACLRRRCAAAGAPGTPQYMAPELWAGRPHTVATDIYAATGVLVGLAHRTPAVPGHRPQRARSAAHAGRAAERGGAAACAGAGHPRPGKGPARPARERGAVPPRCRDRRRGVPRRRVAGPRPRVARGRCRGSARRPGSRASPADELVDDDDDTPAAGPRDRHAARTSGAQAASDGRSGRSPRRR